MQKELWANEKFVKNKTAFEIIHDEAEFNNQVKKSIESSLEIKRPGFNYLRIGQFGENHERILKKFRSVDDEENVNEFIKWLYEEVSTN